MFFFKKLVPVYVISGWRFFKKCLRLVECESQFTCSFEMMAGCVLTIQSIIIKFCILGVTSAEKDISYLVFNQRVNKKPYKVQY